MGHTQLTVGAQGPYPALEDPESSVLAASPGSELWVSALGEGGASGSEMIPSFIGR